MINQGIPLLKTKLMIPAIHKNLVHRPSLISRIENASDFGFVLISTPPGYGKTTLVADWAHSKGESVGWLTLDANDNDLLIMNRYLVAILGDHFSVEDQLLSEIFQNRHPQTIYETLLTLLINVCSESSVDFSFVLDEYQTIHNPQIHAGLVYLLEHFPTNLMLILITRADPPFPLARLRANHRIVELRTDDLTFSLDETDQFLHKATSLSLSEPEVIHLYQKTEGWITGLQLASLSAGKTSLIDQPGVALSSNSHLTIDYLVEEVIDHQSPSVQNFLLQTSILNNLTGPLCDYVIQANNQSTNSQELLHTLYHSNLFLTPLDNEEKMFRYHSLFAVALRHILSEKREEEIPLLYQRASEWCDQNGEYEAALFYAHNLEDKTRYVSLLERYAFLAIKQNQIFVILERVHGMNDDLLSTSPVLSMVKSWEFLLSLDIDTAEIWINKTIELMERPDPVPWFTSIEKDLRGLTTAERSILEIIRGNMESAKQLSKEAVDLLKSTDDFSHGFALLNQGLTLSMNGEIKQAIRVLKETILLSQKSGNKFVTMVARIYLGMILTECCQLNQAKRLLEQSLDFYSANPGKSAMLEILVYKGMANISIERNQLSQAEEYLNKCVEISNSWPQLFSEYDTHLHLAHLFHSKNDAQGCIEELSQAAQLCSHSPVTLDDMIVQTYEVKWALQRDQLLPAYRWLQKLGVQEDFQTERLAAFPYTLADHMQLNIARFHLTRGRLEKNPDDLNLAMEILATLLPKLTKADLVEHLIEAYILQALAYHELNKIGEMLASLNEALIRAEPEEYRQAFLDEGIPMSRALIHFLAAQKQNKINDNLNIRSFVSDLLFRFTGKGTGIIAAEKNVKLASEDQFQLELLTSREIEVLQLVAYGRSNNEIALEMHISVNTVKRHLNNVFMKLGVTNRTQAIRVAQGKNLLQ